MALQCLNPHEAHRILQYSITCSVGVIYTPFQAYGRWTFVRILSSRTDECPFPAVTALGFGRYDMGQVACSTRSDRPKLTDTDTSPYMHPMAVYVYTSRM
ncbi:hypothetical protein H109_06838 [Trichophyton interdigitale MR816]|uniref:Uncharacterized protein n=1 Tax=Trichophyton interdigitale (strain MR816) TaxID=1215338 RepID=A0A059J0P1_TRIIM|nr:hypothetical protein H109_06838 [Trichophyton interdigitale MR816]